MEFSSLGVEPEVEAEPEVEVEPEVEAEVICTGLLTTEGSQP